MPTRPAYFRPHHAPTVTDDRPSAHARGYDRAWQKLRKAHLTEHPFCVFCDAFANVVDHITPVTVDPSRRLDPDNLRSCCPECHNALTTNYRLTGVNELPARHPLRLRTERVGVSEDGSHRGAKKHQPDLLKTGPQSSCFAGRFSPPGGPAGSE